MRSMRCKFWIWTRVWGSLSGSAPCVPSRDERNDTETRTSESRETARRGPTAPPAPRAARNPGTSTTVGPRHR
eukprot:1568634-Prymnesium_polylepis.1